MRYSVHFVDCDAEGCPSQLEGDSPAHVTQLMASEGWSAVKSRGKRTLHFCPGHGPENGK